MNNAIELLESLKTNPRVSGQTRHSDLYSSLLNRDYIICLHSDATPPITRITTRGESFLIYSYLLKAKCGQRLWDIPSLMIDTFIKLSAEGYIDIDEERSLSLTKKGSDYVNEFRESCDT